jgi:hypothetical protein
LGPFSGTNILQIILGDEFKNDRAREALTTLFGSRPRHVAPPGTKYDSTRGRLVPDRKSNRPKLSWWEQAQKGHVYKTRKDKVEERRKHDQTAEPPLPRTGTGAY